MDETIVQTSKTKTVLLLCVAVGFVAIGVWLLTLEPQAIRESRRLNSPLFFYGIGLASIVFFGYCAVAIFRRLSAGGPGLILNQDGLTVRISRGPGMFVPWTEVIDVRPYQTHGQKSVSVFVEDPEKYRRQGSVLARKLSEMNESMTGTPVNITANALKIDAESLLSLIKSYAENHHKNTPGGQRR